MSKNSKSKGKDDAYKVSHLCKLWSITNDYYYKNFKKHHLIFPEPILKELIKNKFAFTTNNTGSYDFDNNIELKSSTTKNGNTPFKFTECDCKTIIYCEIIDGSIEIYKLSNKNVSKINKSIKEAKEKQKSNIEDKTNQLNISCGQYKGKIKFKFDLQKGEFVK